MAGISHIDIEKYFKNESNEDMKRNFEGVILSNSLTRFINFQKILKTDKAPYPFIVMNTDRKNKSGNHWWSFLNMNPKNELLLFDSFGFQGFKVFILSNDVTLIDKLLYGVKFNKKDKKVTVLTVQFHSQLMKNLKKMK